MTSRFARTSLAALILAAALAFGTATPASADALPPQLKPAVVVDGDFIRLGDVWDNLGDKAETPLASAPQPGRRITLENRWLAAVARSYGIDWRPAGTFERVVVERSGQVVDVRAVETELREALRLEGVPANASMEVANRNSLHITIPANATPAIAIRDIIYDQRMNRFSAVVEVPAGSPSAIRTKVGGSIFTSASIPVLSRTMSHGDIISEADIQWVDVREEVVHREIITNTRQLIGQEPRYQLKAGTPIRTADVQKPVVVARNSGVTMLVRTKFMMLSAQGRALEDGSTGDVIRVTNIQSKQVVDAKVVAPGQVSVLPGGMRAQAN